MKTPKVFIGVFVSIFVVDFLTKWFDRSHTANGWHEDPEVLHMGWLDWWFPLALSLGVLFNSAPFACALAGVMGNWSWAAATGGVPNPFMRDAIWIGDLQYATHYNFADVAITAGFFAIAVDLMILAVGLTVKKVRSYA